MAVSTAPEWIQDPEKTVIPAVWRTKLYEELWAPRVFVWATSGANPEYEWRVEWGYMHANVSASGRSQTLELAQSEGLSFAAAIHESGVYEHDHR